MKISQHGRVTLYDYEPTADDVASEVLRGLTAPAKTLPCKLFYDARGSELFEEICTLDEYYPTRTELGILREYGRQMAALVHRVLKGERPAEIPVERVTRPELVVNLVVAREIGVVIPADIVARADHVAG